MKRRIESVSKRTNQFTNQLTNHLRYWIGRWSDKAREASEAIGWFGCFRFNFAFVLKIGIAMLGNSLGS